MPASISLILSKWDIGFPCLLNKTLTIVETWPTSLLCSKSDPPAVKSLAYLKVKAKALYTNLIPSSSIKTESINIL